MCIRDRKEMYERKERDAKKNGEEFENPFKTGELPSTVATVAAGAAKGNFAALFETVKCFAPYATFQFAVLPAIGYAVGGASMATGVLLTSILADVITNVHSFIIIATNHVGDDIYRFETETKPRSDDFYLRAVIGSANFRTGGDLNDFFHGWLNYQIEHHMFPDISMKQYQIAQPKIRPSARSTACRTCRRACGSAWCSSPTSWSESAACSCGSAAIKMYVAQSTAVSPRGARSPASVPFRAKGCEGRSKRLSRVFRRGGSSGGGLFLRWVSAKRREEARFFGEEANGRSRRREKARRRRARSLACGVVTTM